LLRDSKASAAPDGSKKWNIKTRHAGQERRRWPLYGLALLLAISVTVLALLFSGGVTRERDANPPVAPNTPVVPEAVAPAPPVDGRALSNRLEEIAQGHEGTYGIALLDPASGTRISLRGDRDFMAASIGKLPVLATLYRAAARGELALEEEIPILPEDLRDYGDGEFPASPIDDFLSLRECAYRMVSHSDNVAWSMLDRRLGAGRIRSELEGMDIRYSWYSDALSGYFTTPDDVLLLLERISDPGFTSEGFSAEMLSAMTHTHLEDRIPEKLPLEVRVAHKTGSYADNFGDAGIVFYKDPRGVEKRYYLVVLAQGTGEDEARDAIQSISLAVYEALTGTEVDPGWSRGEVSSLT
jgi:beta-lactamase class A